MASELYHTIEAIGREKSIEPEVIIQAVEEAYAAASRKYYRSQEDLGARFDKKTGNFKVFARHTVVEDEEFEDPLTQIPLEEARKIKPDAQVGDVIETAKEDLDAPVSRIAAQAAKQVIYQKVKEAERELVYSEYADRVGELLTGQVKRFDRGDMIVDLGRAEGVIPRREQSRAEHYNPGERIRAVLLHVERHGKGPQLILSRASELLVKKLFEQEVPEIYDGTVTIVRVARDAGERSKVAVRSKDRDVDPVGACVGMKGSRVQAVIRELRGEKIDIVQYDEDPAQLVRNALSPAAINRVAVRDYENREIEVIVPEDQLSLAIGRRGQNVRLASKLSGWKLDIKSEAEKKAEMEAEIERMSLANRELSLLPGIGPVIAERLLNAGFRAIEEVAAASLEDLTSIEGIGESLAIQIHDAAEALLEARERGEGPLYELELEEEARRQAAEEEAARQAAEEAAALERMEAETEAAETVEAVSDEEDAGSEEEPPSADRAGTPAFQEASEADADSGVETPGEGDTAVQVPIPAEESVGTPEPQDSGASDETPAHAGSGEGPSGETETTEQRS